MVKPEDRYAVFLDIDGTLLADSFIIPQRNIDVLNAAREKGHMVFINTGRSWGNIPPVLMEQIEKFDGIIAGSGVMITMNGKTVFSACMSKDLCCRITEYFLSHTEYWCMFEGYKNIYMIENPVRARADYQTAVTSVADMEKICENDEIQVIAMGIKAPEEFIEKFKDEITVFQFERYADCVIKGLNKAKGIEKVLELTGIRKENTIAIGDSNNDMDMIKFAGIGVAMANSQQSILDIADYVTDSNVNCGVAKAIEKFLL